MRVFTLTVIALMMSGLVKAATVDELERRIRDIKAQVADQEKRIIRLEASREQLKTTTPLNSQFNNSSEKWKDINNWKKIVNGMSRRQVESILGEPTSVITDNSAYFKLMYQGDTKFGYISGNVLVSVADDRVVIVSTPVM